VLLGYFWFFLVLVLTITHVKPKTMIMKLFLLFTFLLFGYQTFAQHDSVTVKDIYELSLEELMQISVVSASKVAQRATDAPATVYVITQQQIRNRNYSSLKDLLGEIPQIEIQSKSYAEYSDIFTLNGISGNYKFLIMMDGVRINSVTGTQHTLGESFLLANTKQVEVILGPASSLYGADAFTGIINIITHKGNENKGIHLSSSYGLYNTSNTSLVYGAGNKDVSFSLSGKYYHSDEPFMPDFYPNDFSWYRHYQSTGQMLMFGDTVTPSVPVKSWETPTDAYAVQARFNYKSVEVGFSRLFESHSSGYGYNPSTSIYAREALYANHVQNAYASHSLELKKQKFTLNSTFSTQDFKLYPHSLFLNQYAGYFNAYKYERNRTYKLEEQFHYGFADKYNLVGGVSYEFLNAIPKTSDLPFQYDESKSATDQMIYYPGTNVTDVHGNDLTILQDIYQINYTNLGSYLQLQADLAEQLTLTAGARYDYNSRYRSTFNPRIGIIYKPIHKLHLKFLYGTAYLAPSPYTSYQHYGSFYQIRNEEGGVLGLGSSFWHLPNPNLQPEKRRSLDTYAMYQVNRNFALSLNGYYSKIDNLIATEGHFGTKFHSIPVDYVSKAVNRGEATAYGGTFRLDYRDYITPLLNAHLYAAYSYSDGDIDGNPLIFSAKNTLKSGLDLSFRNKWNVYTSMLYRSASNHRNSTVDNPITNAAFMLVNVSANYKAVNQDNYYLTLFVKSTNVLNGRFYHVGYENLLQTPQDPIRVDVGLKVGI
jgi:outer membrane receptor for ferrienterochelin and colicin